MGIVCGATKLHVDFYNELHQNEVMVSGYSVLYVNWLERKLISAQKKVEAPETIDNNAMFQLLTEKIWEHCVDVTGDQLTATELTGKIMEIIKQQKHS